MASTRQQAEDFAPVSREWLKRSDVAERKRRGQYLTPRGLRERLLDLVELKPGMSVLDPGVGTGEFLASALEREPKLKLSGWDTDPGVLEVAGSLVPGADLRERSAIEPWDGEQFGLVIGNPPYFQLKATEAQKKWFDRVISGRPNIFALFFQAGIEGLADGGQLAYVVPPSLNNGAYFEALREYLGEVASIEHLEVMDASDLFDGANTAVQLIVLRKGAAGNRFRFERFSPESGFRRVIFSSNPEELAAQFEGRKTLWQLGWSAVTGSIVWNQNRELLRAEAGKGTVPLIWSRNVTRGSIEFDGNQDRPEHIVSATAMEGPAVLVNRIVGAVGKGELRAAAVPEGESFLAENHVNVLRPRAGAEDVMPADQLAELINAEGVSERVRMLTGNSQISAKELTHLLPL